MNDLPFELFVAVRYLLARRKQAFISLISFISVIGLMIGVMAVLIALALMQGRLEAVRQPADQMDGIVLGTDLAVTLDVKVGDTVRLITPDEIITPIGAMPHRRAFKVVGIFSLGLYEFDSEYALVDLPVAERVLGTDRPQFMQVRLDDMWLSRQVAEDIPKRLGDEYATQDWAQMNKSLFSALWLEK